MRYERIENMSIPYDSTVTVKDMKSITEIVYNENLNTRPHIIKVSKDEYVHLSTGEIKEFEHKAQNRHESVKSVRRTMSRIRDLVNNNVIHPENTRFCTFTYKELMKDRERLYQDFRKFNQKFQRYLESEGYMKAEYIAVAEPQSRGAWHLHCIYIWDSIAPYIPNNTLAGIWSHGFTKITALDDVTNVASYLVAYLSDMEIPAEHKDLFPENRIKSVDSDGEKKSFIKGQRLKMYPSGFNIVRHSRGIRYPEKKRMTFEEAQSFISDKELSYQTAYKLSDEAGDYETTIIRHEYRNMKK